jgi:hypothetical protein
MSRQDKSKKARKPTIPPGPPPSVLGNYDPISVIPDQPTVAPGGSFEYVVVLRNANPNDDVPLDIDYVYGASVIRRSALPSQSPKPPKPRKEKVARGKKYGKFKEKCPADAPKGKYLYIIASAEGGNKTGRIRVV